ncbi:MAG TPA: hypothetical protein VIF11_10800 [Methylomirabilota bacterium]|jgi:hypothetical protein
MLRRVYWAALAVGLCALLTSAAGVTAQTSTGTADKTASTTDKMKSYTVEKKKEAVAYGKKMMSEFDKQMKDLEKQIAHDSSAAKADAQRQLKDLKAERAATSKKLDELGRASAQSWDRTKHSFADAYASMQQSYDRAAASLKKK